MIQRAWLPWPLFVTVSFQSICSFNSPYSIACPFPPNTRSAPLGGVRLAHQYSARARVRQPFRRRTPSDRQVEGGSASPFPGRGKRTAYPRA